MASAHADERVGGVSATIALRLPEYLGEGCSVIVVRVLTVDDWSEWRVLRLAALRDAPQAFGSKLADWQGEGDSERRWRGRLDGVLLNLLADLDGSPAGMVSGMLPDHDGTVGLISMWVAPVARGRGVGDALVGAVVRWAKERRASRIALRVAEGNHYAMALYRRHGFVDKGPVEDSAEDRLAERKMIREADRD
jgi:GNAT superfamily N-acetyltransferase